MKNPQQTQSYPTVRLIHGGQRRAALLALAGTMALAGNSFAGTSTWQGGGSDEYWATSGNWDVDPVTGDDLIFDGIVNSYTNNDLEDSLGSGVFSPNSITFAATAGDGFDFFEIDGNPLNLNGKTITNDSPYQHDILCDVQESGSGITFAGQGDLYVQKLANNTWNHQLTKNGSGTLHVVASNDSIKIAINDGMVEWDSGNGTTQLDIHGGTFACTGGVNPIWYGSTVNLQNDAATLPSTLSLPGNATVEFRVLNGAAGALVDNLGIGGETTVLKLRKSNSNYAGLIEDGAGGGITALELNNADAPQTVTLSGDLTYSGGTVIASGATLSLASSGSMTFYPETAGVVNGVTGGGSANIDGLFIIELGGVGTPTTGDSWSLIGTTATYGSNFEVSAPFAETAPDSGIWVYNDGSDDYFFSESSGTLSYGRSAETVWTGGGGDDLWSTNPNWNQNPLTGDLLLFDGSTQTTNTNDLDTNFVPEDATDPENIIPADPATFFVSGIRFEPTADPFTLQGNPLDFVDKTITNNSPNTQTIELGIQCDANVGGGGFTVDAAAGDVVLNDFELRNNYNKPLTKIGSETLTLMGPLVGSGTWQPFVNQGTMVAAWDGNLFFHSHIAAGATLRTEFNVIHNGGRVENNGTLDIAEGVDEDVGALYGSGKVTNHGAGGTTSTISMRQGDNRTFSGTIEDGPSGGQTAVQVGLAGRTETGIFTLSGANTYTGNTTMGEEFAGLILAETGSMAFAPGANGVTNQITALVDQNTGTGTVALNGNFRVDLSNADTTHGNSWNLVDSANLNETYGATFQVSNANYAPATAYQVNGGSGDYAPYVNNGGFVTGGGNASWPADTRNLAGVTDPAPATVYDEYRYGSDFTYTFTGLGAGTGYDIRLHFLEGWHSTAGNRVFDVIVNGVTVIDDIDLITASGGKNVAFTQTINATADLSGQITVRFLDSPAGSDSNAAVSAVEITPDGSGSSANFTESGDVWTMVDGANTWTFTEATGVLSLSTGAGGGDFASWIGGYPGVGMLTGFDDDADKDGLTNGEESFFGTDPSVANAGVTSVGMSGGNFTFEHPQSASVPSDVTAAYRWSLDLANWHADGATDSGTTVDFSASPDTPSAGTTTVTASVSGAVPSSLFTNIEVTQTP